MATSKIKLPQVRCLSSVEDVNFSSHNEAIEMQVLAKSPSGFTPSISLNIRTDGLIQIYSDTGTGWALVRQF